MTTDDEVRWDARQFQIDRFDLHVTETSRDNSAGNRERNERVASLYGLSKSPLLCQVWFTPFPFFFLRFIYTGSVVGFNDYR